MDDEFLAYVAMGIILFGSLGAFSLLQVLMGGV